MLIKKSFVMDIFPIPAVKIMAASPLSRSSHALISFLKAVPSNCFGNVLTIFNKISIPVKKVQ